MSDDMTPAYPCKIHSGPDYVYEFTGLTKRELFTLELTCALLSNGSLCGSVKDILYFLDEGVEAADILLANLSGEKK